MNKLTPYFTIIAFFLLLFCSITATAQDFGCGATEINQNLPLKDFQLINGINSTEKTNGTWNYEDGYKVDATCEHNCNVAPFNNAPPSATCNNGVYQMPVKIWIVADNDGTNQAVTATQAADQIGYLNTYHACNGIPIELVQVVGSPEIINNTGFNSFNNPFVSGSGSDDNLIGAAFSQANVVNIYIPSTIGSGSGCNGYAYLPGGPDRILMAGACFTPVADPCVNTQSSVVFIHEFGHYLGLLHTHGSYAPGNPGDTSPPFRGAVSLELVDGSNACTTGDFIHDTPADLGISASESANSTNNPVGGCASGAGCASVFTCTDANGQAYTPSLNNIMNYNNLNGCRQEYSDCQKAKMVDALVCSRTNLCAKTVTDFFASADASLREKNICSGDAIPSFTANDACKNWYAYDGSTRGALLFTGINFNPGANASLSNTNTGVHEYWVNDANEFSPTCGSAIKLTIEGNSAAASPVVSTIVGSGSINLSATGSSFSSTQSIGWWITSNNPASTGINSQSSLDAAVSAAAIGGTVTTPANNIFQSNTNGNQDYNLTIDCNDPANASESFYATPYIAEAAPAAVNSTSTAIPYSANDIEGFGGSAPFHPGVSIPIQVSGVPAGASLDQICLFVDHNLISDLNFRLQAPNGTSRLIIYNLPFLGSSPFTPNIGTASTPACIVNIGAGGASQGACNGPSPPCLQGNIESQANFNAFTGDMNGIWQLIAYDKSNDSNFFSGTVENVELKFSPTAPMFPSASYTNCVFGTPALINCAALLPIELVTFQGEQKGDQINLNWHTANEKNNDFFTLEKKDANGVFQEIAVVKGAGTTSENQFYDEIDFRPVPGQNLYRLKQTDFDGTTTTSSIVSVNFKANETVSFFPNPVKGGAFTLQYLTEKNAGEALLEIFALNGQKLYTQNLVVETGSNLYEIRVNDFPKGVFLARVINGNSVHSFKLTNVK